MDKPVDALTQERLPGEQEWLRLALLTDRDGILTTTRQRLTRIAHARGMEPSIIDDIVQETLLEAWSHLERLRSLAGFHSWIDEICRNICRRFAHKQTLDLRRNVPLPQLLAGVEEGSGGRSGGSLLDSLALDNADPLDELSRQDRAMLLDRALGELPEATRRLVEMCYLLEIPRAEVASRLSITSGTLQTRLHRARRHLYQILHGPLRQQAEAAGLLAATTQDEGWQETRLWCPLCGTRRLQGCFFEPEDAHGPNLHLRCPECSRRYGHDTVHSMGLVSLAGLRTFQPAWKRTMRGLTEHMKRTLAQGEHACLYCGNPALVQVQSSSGETFCPPGPYSYWLQFECVTCGKDTNVGCMPSVDQLVYWSHPFTQQFVQEHPRWHGSPGKPGKYEGQEIIQFELADREDNSRLIVFAHRHTLRVLAIFPEGLVLTQGPTAIS